MRCECDDQDKARNRDLNFGAFPVSIQLWFACFWVWWANHHFGRPRNEFYNFSGGDTVFCTGLGTFCGSNFDTFSCSCFSNLFWFCIKAFARTRIDQS
jgi:hypothetical protein